MRYHTVASAALAALALPLSLCAGAPPNAEQPFRAIRCEGAYSGHLQGVCTDGQHGIYWSFTDVLVKTDDEGRIVKRVGVASHHGDLCHRDGRIYVAVNLGEFNKPAGHADSWVYVYDADTLAEIARHAVPQVVHGAGGIALGGGRFLVVGGLPGGINENYLYEYDASLVFKNRHVLASGHTLMGIQTAEFADGQWWFGCYGVPKVLLRADDSCRLSGRWTFDASLGIVGLGEGRFLIARGWHEPDHGFRGELKPAVVDGEHGLRLVE